MVCEDDLLTKHVNRSTVKGFFYIFFLFGYDSVRVGDQMGLLSGQISALSHQKSRALSSS